MTNTGWTEEKLIAAINNISRGWKWYRGFDPNEKSIEDIKKHLNLVAEEIANIQQRQLLTMQTLLEKGICKK